METIVLNGKTYYSEQTSKVDKRYEEMWEWFVKCEVENTTTQARDLYEDMKQKGLTLGIAEAEGFLRACLALRENAQHIEQNLLGEGNVC